MSSYDLRVNNQVLFLSGEVTFKTVNLLSVQLQRLMTTDVAQLDCSAVDKVDSSALALLLSALKFAARQNTTLEIIHTPDALKKLAKLYGVELLLAPISTS